MPKKSQINEYSVEWSEKNVDFLLDMGLVHNLVSIIPNLDLYILQKFEDNIDYFGL